MDLNGPPTANVVESKTVTIADCEREDEDMDAVDDDEEDLFQLVCPNMVRPRSEPPAKKAKTESTTKSGADVARDHDTDSDGDSDDLGGFLKDLERIIEEDHGFQHNDLMERQG